jgi:hypothetical protein
MMMIARGVHLIAAVEAQAVDLKPHHRRDLKHQFRLHPGLFNAFFLNLRSD